MKVRSFVTSIVPLMLFTLVAQAGAVDFPGRQKEKYKDMHWSEIEELHQEYLDSKVAIIDVRSKLEYETIHINGALHIPLAGQGFDGKLKKFIKTTPGKKIAFY